jgi:hypothetical protein
MFLYPLRMEREYSEFVLQTHSFLLQNWIIMIIMFLKPLCSVAIYILDIAQISQVSGRDWRAVIAQSVQRWATGWTIGVLRFDSRRGLGIFLFTTAYRTDLGPTQPPIQWVLGALSLGIKQPGREADHSPPSNAEVKECVELYLHSPNTPSWRGAQLKHRTNFTFTLPERHCDIFPCSGYRKFISL